VKGLSSNTPASDQAQGPSTSGSSTTTQSSNWNQQKSIESSAELVETDSAAQSHLQRGKKAKMSAPDPSVNKTVENPWNVNGVKAEVCINPS
jgi:hypothetical protein